MIRMFMIEDRNLKRTRQNWTIEIKYNTMLVKTEKNENSSVLI